MTLPRLLTGLRADRALSLAEHERVHGVAAAGDAPALIDAVEQRRPARPRRRVVPDRGASCAASPAGAGRASCSSTAPRASR